MAAAESAHLHIATTAAAVEIRRPPAPVPDAVDHLRGEDPLVTAEHEAEARVLLADEPEDLSPGRRGGTRGAPRPARRSARSRRAAVGNVATGERAPRACGTRRAPARGALDAVRRLLGLRAAALASLAHDRQEPGVPRGGAVVELVLARERVLIRPARCRSSAQAAHMRGSRRWRIALESEARFTRYSTLLPVASRSSDRVVVAVRRADDRLALVRHHEHLPPVVPRG